MKLSQDTRVLAFGCGGMLGQAVQRTFGSKTTFIATDIDVNESWIQHLDVRKRDDVEAIVADFRPDLVLNLAALVDLEYCELHPDEAFLTNAVGHENVALAATNQGAVLVYISTAGIFDGTKHIYHDYDQPNPISVYARSKYAAERFTQQCSPRHYVFRAGWMMGGGARKDKKFVGKLLQQIRQGVDVLYVVGDKLGTPTYTLNLAENMWHVIESDQFGLYNMASSGQGSRHDVACEIVDALGLQERIRVEKVTSAYWQDAYFAPRPASEQLLNLKLTLNGLNKMRSWQNNLRLYLDSPDWHLSSDVSIASVQVDRVG